MRRALICPALVVAALALFALGIVLRTGPTSAGASSPSAFANSYAGMLQVMRRQAAAAELEINPDIYVLYTDAGGVMYATVPGVEDLQVPDDFVRGADVGFLYLAGVRDVPDGFYVLHAVIDPDAFARGDEEPGIGLLIGADGPPIRVPLLITPDPTPERGPRKALTVEGRRSEEECSEYVESIQYDANDTCWVFVYILPC